MFRGSLHPTEQWEMPSHPAPGLAPGTESHTLAQRVTQTLKKLSSSESVMLCVEAVFSEGSNVTNGRDKRLVPKEAEISQAHTPPRV